MNALERLKAADPLIGSAFAEDDALRTRLRAAVAAKTARMSNRSRRSAGLVIAAAIALALPVAAFSGLFDSLFGFSNNGSHVDPAQFDLRLATALSQIGADQDVRLLATRNGLAFYAAKSRDGSLCLFDGQAGQPAPDFNELWCLSRSIAGHFPSPANPVLDYSWLPVTLGGAGDSQIAQLKGFAADGVASVELIASDGTIVAAAAVEGNVYASTPLPPTTSGATIIALDSHANAVWTESLSDRQR